LVSVNTLFKQCIYPTIYCLIGKRYSGKTTLSKVLQDRMNINTLDFNKIYKKEKNQEKICQKLIKKLENERTQRIILENFPQNKEQYKYNSRNYINLKIKGEKRERHFFFFLII